IGCAINAPTADLVSAPPGATIEEPEGGDSGLSGPMTRAHLARAEADAMKARAEFIAGEAIPEGVGFNEGSSGTLTVTEDDVIPSGPEQSSGPREVGDLKEQPLIRVVYRLARSKGTGMLTLEGRAGVLKEAYFSEGQ